jgi:small-conductance mechanosensitive channel
LRADGSIAYFGGFSEQLVHPLITQTRRALQSSVKVVGFITGMIAIFAPLGIGLFISAGLTLACFFLWLWLDEVGDSENVTLWPPGSAPK